MVESQKRTYYVDGHFVEAEQAVIPVDDLAILRGLGVCDLMRTFNKVPYFLKEHVARLESSARKVGLDLPWSISELMEIVMKTLEKNPGMEDTNIRMIITGGSSPDFMTPRGNPRLIVMVTPIPSIPETWYTRGVKVITTPAERVIPGAKSISYISAVMAVEKARRQDAVEALLVNPDGFVPEGTTSNLFAFVDNTLVTADTGVLKGITRRVILSLAEKMFKADLRTLHRDELLRAEEVFISGTNKGVVPVVRIDDHPVGDGVPGKNTLALINALKKHMSAFKNPARSSISDT